MEKYGIDVSHDNGSISWGKALKDRRIDFVILRIHQRSGADAQFKRNYKKLKKRAVPMGGYKYSYALNPKQAKAEARAVLKLIKGKTFQYPIFYDLEWDGLEELGPDAVEEIALTFLQEVEGAGFRVGIYCNQHWYDTVLTPRLKRYDCWIASYPYDDQGEPVDRLRPLVGVGWQYSEKGAVNGIMGDVDLDVFYTDYTVKMQEAVQEQGTTAEDVLSVARGWIGWNETDGSHEVIIDLYNGHTPLAMGYRVQYDDEWCDTFVSACFIKAGAVSLIGGTECGVERHIQLFKQKGIWIEDGTVTPRSGDIICYNWDEDAQPNEGFADHIGLVDTVGDGVFTAIEGNMNGAVGRRTIPIGWGHIRGFARPAYAPSVALGGKTIEELAREVLDRKWGNGEERRIRLTEAGYDYEKVQLAVNDLVSKL